ncbi:hypothetical protein GSI_01266 [Ganoderma sinense ZZ0214-1]|uniref:Uncharacterized protein n=1 Tax=Ganoderma sinense ZZ0214-1 TaxID=1077348 RepID=A0A2G8SV15_9APHY|nr:hypothetical protein GSI_01266 [Ganoderma sinense ZZ0214-1]
MVIDDLDDVPPALGCCLLRHEGRRDSLSSMRRFSGERDLEVCREDRKSVVCNVPPQHGSFHWPFARWASLDARKLGRDLAKEVNRLLHYYCITAYGEGKILGGSL